MQKIGARTYGISRVAMATIFRSTAGLFVRPLDLDVWTMLAWRSAFAAISLALIVIVKNRRDTLRSVRVIGWPGLIGVPIVPFSDTDRYRTSEYNAGGKVTETRP
jgi:hypothetical protein